MREEAGNKPTTLLQQAARLYDDNDDGALLELATGAWSNDLTQLPEGMGEVCRYAFIRAHENAHPDANLFYARALAVSVVTQSRTTMAGLLLKVYFTSLDVARRNRLGADAYQKARQIVDLIPALVPDAETQRGGLFARLYHDKRACGLLFEATSGGAAPALGGEAILKNARNAYSESQRFTSSSRGKLKVAGGVALVDYLLSAFESDSERKAKLQSDALGRTRKILDDASGAGYDDVAGWARTNVEAMESGGFVGWTPYEVL